MSNNDSYVSSLELLRSLFSLKKSMAEDVAMMDVDESIKSNWVEPPDARHELLSLWRAKTSTTKNLTQFLSRWPPSRTPEVYGPWISAQRADRRKIPTTPPDLPGLSASFQALSQSGTVNVETLDQISKAHNVVSGKWMIFEEPDKIDMLWEKVVHCICVERQKGSAKVSTWKDGTPHVICVYVDDYTDLEEVDELRKALKALGVDKRIGFKTDAYTHLDIYKGNAWKIRPSRYIE